MKYDFSGYATKANLRCSDGRIIRRDAFKDCDGNQVPLVYQHLRDDPKNIIGHARLENRADGVYAYCKLNNTDTAQTVKELVQHGDVKAMSIYANHLSQQGSSVTHGAIREVSIVIAGANPGAYIDNICISHSDGEEVTLDDEAVFYNGWNIEHGESGVDTDFGEQNDDDNIVAEHADGEENKAATVKEVFDSLTDDQKTLFYAMVGQALSDDEMDEEIEQSDENEGGNNDMSYNVFEKDSRANRAVLEHSDMETIFKDAKKMGSLRDAVDEYALEHGITDINSLFPDPKSLTNSPAFVGEPEAWVSNVWNGTSKSPFSRVKSVFADITKDEARARGYIKGKQKVEEQFSLLKRITDPQTVYKKQSLDRDDVVDITDFDVVAWLKAEMRMKLQEELARAILIGDGRLPSDDDKIQETHIRSILNDADFYALKKTVTMSSLSDKTAAANAFIDGVVEGMIDYKGSGAVTAYMAPQTLATLRVAKDTTGRRLYANTDEIASALGVNAIIEVPPMKGLVRTDSENKRHNVLAIVTNIRDYNVGADRGGQTTMFDDFDIDYNKYKYLIETRCSGALVKPASALVVEEDGVEAAG